MTISHRDLLLPTDEVKAACGKIYIPIFLIMAYFINAPVYCIFGIFPVIPVTVLSGLLYFGFKLHRFYGCNSVISLFLSTTLAVYLSDGLSELLHLVFEYDCNRVFEKIYLSFDLFFVFSLIFGLFLYYGAVKESVLKNMMKLTAGCGAFLFLTLIYIPCDSYINNFVDFNFPITAFIYALAGRFILFLLPFSYLGAILKDKPLSVLFNIFCGLTLGVFAQFMFMNRNLGLVMGDKVDWDKYEVFGIITLLIWIALLALPFILSLIFKKTWKRFGFAVPGFIGAMHIISLIILLITTDNNIFIYRNDLLDGKDQYVVSAKKNIVTFVFDAVDNTYFEELLDTRPEVFDELEDFTLYTNTCSVFDYTLSSVTQMLTGADSCPMYDTDGWLEEAWKSQKAEDFYSKLHNAGYIVNGYMQANILTDYLTGKFDNNISEPKQNDIDKQGITEIIMDISRYRYMPYLAKRFVNIQEIDFKSYVKFASNEFNFQNSDYERDLYLTKSDSDKNFFIFEHLIGAHPPCDSPTDETVHCLNIVKEYIRQLKEMDLYDDAFIIVTSDHGRHTSNFKQAASTPIFMVKEAGKTHEKMQITNAPQYHSDFLATYLYAAGIYTDADKAFYGKTVFDYGENDIRERIWYDHREDKNKPNPNGASCNVYYAYKYSGDAEDLKDTINNGEPYQIIVKK